MIVLPGKEVREVRYAEDLLFLQRTVFERVVVRKDYRSLTDYYAKAGAVGYIVGRSMMGSDATVLFEESSAGLVMSNAVGQCSLSIPASFLIGITAELALPAQVLSRENVANDHDFVDAGVSPYAGAVRSAALFAVPEALGWHAVFLGDEQLGFVGLRDGFQAFRTVETGGWVLVSSRSPHDGPVPFSLALDSLIAFREHHQCSPRIADL